MLFSFHVTVLAINRSVTVWLEWNLSFFPAICAGNFMHFSWSTEASSLPKGHIHSPILFIFSRTEALERTYIPPEFVLRIKHTKEDGLPYPLVRLYAKDLRPYLKLCINWKNSHCRAMTFGSLTKNRVKAC
jgi:hypothetical protein